MTMQFLSWRRPAVYGLAADPPVLINGRLTGELVVTLEDAPGGGVIDSADGRIPFALAAAHDVAALVPGQILRRVPAESSRDAETTKLVHVDFAAPNFPWLLVPRKAVGDVLAPWLVVVVATPTEVKLDGQTATVFDPVVFTKHPLANSHLWAHVQRDASGQVARILCPRLLDANTEYLGLVVIAFNDAGQPAWDPAAGRTPTTLTVLDSWRFWTGEAGDFETLATAITPQKVEGLGSAPLVYPPESATPLAVRGAITGLGADADGAAVAPARAALSAYKAAADALRDDLGRRVAGLTTYGSPWVGSAVPTWATSLNTDPRFRGTAGLGLWMGVEGQEKLVAAAAKQIGAGELVGHLVRGLVLGLEVARSLWDRRLPGGADPERRLYALAPLTRRLRARRGTAMDAVTGSNSPLEPSLFSTAARRVFRRGGSATRHHPDRVVRRGDLVRAANRCPRPPERAPDGLPHVDAMAAALGLPPPEHPAVLNLREIPPAVWAAAEALIGLRVEDTPRFSSLLRRLTTAIRATLGECRRTEEAIRGRVGEIVTRDMIAAAVCQCVGEWQPQRPNNPDDRIDLPGLRQFVCERSPPPPRPPCREPDLPGATTAIGDALNPHADRPPAVVRVQDRIEGWPLHPLTPPQIPVSLDFPAWTLLRDHAREWLLPGVGRLPPDAVVALQTNPTFIDAFLVGLNAQAQNEFLWRGLPADRTGTPLLMFWGHADFETGKRRPDVQPLRDWPAASDLGDTSHQLLTPGDDGARDLVIAFRTDLFRRYPSTLVYLVKPGADVDADLKATPAFAHTAADRAARKFIGPIFQGAIAADLVFFAFDIHPDELAACWLVLDEPPSELRFRGVDEVGAPIPTGAVDAADFAIRTIDTPTRVAISGAYLRRLGL